MTFAAACVIDIVAFALLALSMRRHFARVFGREITRRQRLALRSGGWMAVAASLAFLLLASDTPGEALVWLAASLTVAGWTVALGLAFGFRARA